MARRLIWIDEKEITGWGCADCAWMLTNRKNELDLDLPVGQDLRMEFADHNCERHPRLPKSNANPPAAIRS